MEVSHTTAHGLERSHLPASGRSCLRAMALHHTYESDAPAPCCGAVVPSSSCDTRDSWLLLILTFAAH